MSGTHRGPSGIEHMVMLPGWSESGAEEGEREDFPSPQFLMRWKLLKAFLLHFMGTHGNKIKVLTDQYRAFLWLASPDSKC